jgi:crotonobetainyl-CoA:carnitine CoA-transferase CaiB-like acyl-CoA transferase
VRSGDEIVDRLWGAGVPVAKVMQPHDQPTLPQLQFRGFFEEVDRPVTGTARHSTLPIRFSRGADRFHRCPAPLLGEHNDEVLRDLGISDDEMAELDDLGVIGRVPDTARRSHERSRPS